VVLENLANVNLGADLTVLNQQARVAVSYTKLLHFTLLLHKRGSQQFYFMKLVLNIMSEWLALLLHIQEVLHSNLDPETAILIQVSHGFPLLLQVNARIVS
jgi:hypothetical protein